jgi:hypothetical protein
VEITVEQKKIKLDDRILTELDNFHKNAKSIYNEKDEQLKSAFDIISVKDGNDVIKANDLFKKLKIKVISNKNTFLKNNKKNPVENNFMIKDSEGWRIQSHYIGWGMNTEDLEKCVDYILGNGNIDTTKDYTKDKIKSRIEELKEGKKVYDANEKLTIKDNKIKGSYTKEAHAFWKNVDMLIKELESLVK